jgi:hypothetical protein
MLSASLATCLRKSDELVAGMQRQKAAIVKFNEELAASKELRVDRMVFSWIRPMTNDLKQFVRQTDNLLHEMSMALRALGQHHAALQQ